MPDDLRTGQAGMQAGGKEGHLVNLLGLSTHQVHQAARFWAAAEATTRGHHVSVVGPHTRLRVDGQIAQVAARRQPGSPWQVHVHRPVVDDAAAMIFVDLTGEIPDFYLAPAEWVREDVRRHHAAWLASVGGDRPHTPASTHHTIDLDRIKGWWRRWDILR